MTFSVQPEREHLAAAIGEVSGECARRPDLQHEYFARQRATVRYGRLILDGRDYRPLAQP